MKKIHIIGIIIIAVAIGVIVSLVSDTRTYSDFNNAAKSPEVSFDIVGVLDTTMVIAYDAKVNPDAFSFYMVDDLGTKAQVVCYKPLPQDFKRSKKVVVSGSMKNGRFEATNILLKCPSKYESEGGKPMEFGVKKI